MKINGYDVLISERSWMAWRAKNLYSDDNRKPKEYPCIADCYLDSSEDPYPVYSYQGDINQLHATLLAARNRMLRKC